MDIKHTQAEMCSMIKHSFDQRAIIGQKLGPIGNCQAVECEHTVGRAFDGSWAKLTPDGEMCKTAKLATFSNSNILILCQV